MMTNNSGSDRVGLKTPWDRGVNFLCLYSFYMTEVDSFFMQWLILTFWTI